MSEVADTSLKAFKQKVEDGSIETDKERCFAIIEKHGPITQSDMELHMGKNKHKFSGRIRELKDNDLIEVTGTENGHQLLETRSQSDVETTKICDSDVFVNESVTKW